MDRLFGIKSTFIGLLHPIDILVTILQNCKQRSRKTTTLVHHASGEWGKSQNERGKEKRVPSPRGILRGGGASWGGEPPGWVQRGEGKRVPSQRGILPGTGGGCVLGRGAPPGVPPPPLGVGHPPRGYPTPGWAPPPPRGSPLQGVLTGGILLTCHCLHLFHKCPFFEGGMRGIEKRQQRIQTILFELDTKALFEIDIKVFKTDVKVFQIYVKLF